LIRFVVPAVLLWLPLIIGICSSAAAASSVPVLPPSVEEFQSYSIGIGDKILVEVYGESDLSLESEVGPLGSINYPFIGEIKVDGVTVQSLKEQITRGLKGPYLIDPVVSVKVVEYRKIFLNGYVSRPGAYQFQPGLTVRKAIAIAGGFGERADEDKIFVVPADQPNAAPRKIGLDEKLAPGDVLTVDRSFF